MKKASSDIIDVDGETVSVNKVDAALASVGVSLKNAKGEFRDLDDVFLELSSKWNSLDVMSQRYIATMAAGSRQQSRFIAMMQDYDRTIELVNAAYGSAGSSSKQFEKTQESLASKWERLQNAWNVFLMGISNNSIIKKAIDLLTDLLNILNKITTIPDFLPFNQIGTSILKIAAAIGVLKAANRGVQKILNAYQASAAATREMRSINLTGAFSNGQAASPEDVAAAKGGNKKYFKNKTNQKKIKIPAEIDINEAESTKEGAKNGSIISEAATTAAKANPIDTDSNNIDAVVEGKEYGTLWGRTAESTVHEQPISSEADILNAMEQGAVWARAFKKGMYIEFDQEGLGKLNAFYQFQGTGLSTYVSPQGEVPLALPPAEIPTGGIPVDYTPVSPTTPKRGPLKGSFLEGMEDSKLKTKQFFGTIEGETGKIQSGFSRLKEGAKSATTKVAGGFGKVAGVIAGIPGPVWAVVGGIAAVTAAVYLLWKTSDSQVLKEKLEEATKTTERLSAAVQELSERISSVNESFNSLAEQKETLHSLVQGTLAWNEALLKNNETVLELIKNNPELKEYLEIGQNGEMSISKKGKDAYIKKLLKKQSGAQMGQYYSQAYQDYLTGEQALLDAGDLVMITKAAEKIGTYQYVEPETIEASEAYDNGMTPEEFKENNEDYKVQAYSEYYNKRKTNEVNYAKKISARAGSYLDKDATELEHSVVEKIAGSMALNNTSIIGKTIKGMTVEKSGFSETKMDVKSATAEDVKKLSDEELAIAGFEWADKDKTKLKVIGSDSTTTYEVTKYGHVDTEENLKYYEKKNKDHPINIDAGFIMAKVAQGTLPELSNAAAAAMVEGLDEEALRLLNGEVLSSDELENAENSIKQQYDNIDGQIKEQKDLKKELEAKGKGDEFDSTLLEQLEETKTYYDNLDLGLGTDNFSLGSLNEQNKEQLKNTLGTYGFNNVKDWTNEQLNSYKKAIDHFSKLSTEGTAAINAFNAAYNKATNDTSRKLLTDFATSLDTSSAIKGYQQLKEGAKSADEAISDFSNTMLKNAERGGFYSGLNQLKELVSSEEFTELSSQLAEIAKEGEISASDILDLADSNVLLKSALDAGALSAGALAEIFQEMSAEGKDLTDFTQDYINYLNELTSSATQAAKSLKFVKDFQMPESQTAAQESWEQWATELQERAAAGAFNDQAFTALLKNFASSEQWENWEKSGTSNEERYKDLQPTINNSAKGSYSMLLAGAEEKQTTENATYLKNGQLTFNLSNIKTSEELISKIAKQYGISEEYARQLITDARIYNTELNKALNKMDQQNAFLQDFYVYGQKSEDGKYNFSVNNDFAKERGYEDADAYVAAFTETVGDAEVTGITVNTTEEEMTRSSEEIFNEKVESYFSNRNENYAAKIVGAGRAAGLSDEEILDKGVQAYKDNTNDDDEDVDSFRKRLQDALTSAQDVADAEQKANIAEQAAEVYDSYFNAVTDAMKAAMSGLEFPITIDLKDKNGHNTVASGKFTFGEGTQNNKASDDYKNKAEQAKTDAKNMQDAYNETLEELKEDKDVTPKTQNDLEAGKWQSYGSGGDENGGGDSETEEVEKRNYASENSDKQLEALERVRETNDREAELIDKLPEEIQYPLKMMNMAEDIASEYQEIQINKNKLAALEQERAIADAQAIEEGMLGAMGSDLPIYYDEALGSYMWNVEAMNNLSDEQREKAHETMDELSELNSSIEEVKQELDGGKIQKIFHTAGNASKSLSKAFKDTEGKTDDLGEAFEEIGKKYGLGDQFKALGQKIEGVIDSSEKLDKEFEGLGIVSEETLSKLDSLPIGEDTKNLIKNTFGTNQGGTVGSWTGDLLGAGGEMLTGIGDVLNFDMMSMGLDMFNQTKDMASQMIQYVVQFVQTIVSWWTNREDWLYNLLSAIEQEVRNFNRQGEVEERFRLYSDEGLEELVSAWKAMRVSLEKQIDLNEQLIQSRQAELQFLNLTNLPFSPAFYYDYEEERVIENPWVYDIYSLLLDIGAMIPGIGGIFSSIKQLMEDNKQRMESAVSEIEDARDEILELEKQQLELRTKYMDDEIELEELVMDAIIEKQQEEIDELTAMNDAIVEGNQKLIDALNEKLELIRQQRENEDREEELGQKERRLAFLRQDTSNANRKEILDLTDELKKERRDYTDELIDQKISALEKQNDEAAEQRQKQIDLMQEQLDYTEKYGLQWAEAQTLIKNGFDSEGRLRVGTDLYNMLMSKEDFTSLGFGSTRQVKQLMDWDVTNIAAAAFRTINDVWEQGFGNFAMSNDVHEQGSLHLWADREIEYRQLPSWLSFLQPAYNSIQDYLWRTGNNIGAFAETAYGSDKNSTSILGKTLIPALENLFGSIKDKYNDYISVDASETGGVEVFPGIIGSTLDSRSRDWGERSIRTLGDGLESIGRSLTDGLTKVAETNILRASASSQNIGDMTMNFYINSEDEENGTSIASSIIEAFREGVSNLSIFK